MTEPLPESQTGAVIASILDVYSVLIHGSAKAWIDAVVHDVTEAKRSV